METMEKPAAETAVADPNRLAWLLANAKENEAIATAARLECETALIAALGGAKEEGSKTHKLADFKVTVTGVLNRKIDLDAFDAIADKIPENLRPIKVKREVDPAGCKYLERNEPEVWKLIAPCVTTKPGKTGCEIERKAVA